MTMPNRLINETSPYLLQHAHNPVDWYPWGPEAFARASAEDKPIFLSIGYSACHWCHVMESESFQDQDIARMMNHNFVSIKVDREERPDVDSIYMQAVQAQTGRGGWPMTVFMTPDAKPFFSGTYFPPEDGHGLPGFPRVLQAIAQAYKDSRDDLIQSAEQLVAHMRSGILTTGEQEPLTNDILSGAYQGMASQFDEEHGGLGTAPKFPQAMAHELLLLHHARTGNAETLEMVETSLQHMARGGIYDQLGGGFHRYSTDQFWLVPHFEKMLYDNALLSRLYLHAYQVTGNPEYRRIVEETLDYVLREMTAPAYGFYSTQDADSEGEEGRFFVWTTAEIEAALGKDDSAMFCLYYGVTLEGNFDGRNILYVPRETGEVAQEVGVGEDELDVSIQKAREQLMMHRQKRIAPDRDEKVLTAWNGLMLRSFSEAAATLHREDYRAAAIANASFLLDTMRSPDGRLLRTYKDGSARLKGYLEDYAFLIDGLLALHEATLDLRWLREARSLADRMIDLFWDDTEQAFYDTGRDHEELIIRPRDVFDNATPSGGSVAADVLLRLSILTDNSDYSRRATATLRSLRPVMLQAPAGFGHWLCALDFHLSTPKEIVIVGPQDNPVTQALLDQVHHRYIPNKVVTGYDPSDTEDVDDMPLLEDKKTITGQPAAYVCHNYVCLLPATEPLALAAQLGA
jgi:uncharacterized protein YyaL (SSP411 family)